VLLCVLMAHWSQARDRIVLVASEQTTRLDHVFEESVAPRLQSARSALPSVFIAFVFIFVFVCANSGTHTGAVHSAVGMAQEKLHQVCLFPSLILRVSDIVIAR
jgi:hypothetical protein